MADDAIFRIYSMTKPIASVALMQLYERGMFQLLDPVHRYIPEWRTLQVGVVARRRHRHPGEARAPDEHARRADAHDRPARRAVPRQSRSTPPSTRPAPDSDGEQTLESVTALLAEHPLKFHPGTHWNYGISTDIVGRLVEILSGLRLDEYLRREVFEPLGMVDTGFFVPEESLPRLGRLLPVPPGQHPPPHGGPVRQRHPASRAPTSPERAGWSRPPTTTWPSARCWPTAASSTAGGSSGARPWSS